jgi:hypothetical chaperone protein
MKNNFYAIDFGTTNTVAAFLDENNQPQLIKLDEKSDNQNILRTVIYVSKKGKFLFGKSAIDTYNSDVAKQKAGKRKLIKTGTMIKVTSDASATSGYKPDKIVEQMFESEVTDTGRLLQGIKSLLGNESLKEVDIFGNKYAIEELVGIFLTQVKTKADKFTGTNVTKAVIGRPVRFVGKNNKLAEKRLISAAKLAGFKKVVLQMEPIGAAYDHGMDADKKANILVFDFGGGTLDLSVVKLPQMEVLANEGMTLGGDLINSRIFLEKISAHFGRGKTFGVNAAKMPESLYQQLQHWYSISLLKTEMFSQSLDTFSYNHSDPKAVDNLRELVFKNLGFSLYEAIDKMKKTLSQKDIAEFDFKHPSVLINENMLRGELEEILANDLAGINQLIISILKNAGISKEDIDLVLLTGGSSLIPVVRKLLIGHFGEEKLKDRETFTSVASGLAVYGKEIFEQNSCKLLQFSFLFNRQ